MACEFGNVHNSVDLNPFVSVSNLLVVEELSAVGHSPERLNAIAQFLAAHFAAIALHNSGMVKKSIGQTSEQYSSPDGKAAGFAITHWGKQAMALDTSGTLSAISTQSNAYQAQFTVFTGRESFDSNGAKVN